MTSGEIIWNLDGTGSMERDVRALLRSYRVGTMRLYDLKTIGTDEIE